MLLYSTLQAWLSSLDLSSCGGHSCSFGSDPVTLEYDSTFDCYFATDVCVGGRAATVYLYWDSDSWVLEVDVTDGDNWQGQGPATPDDPTGGGTGEFTQIPGTGGNNVTVTVTT